MLARNNSVGVTGMLAGWLFEGRGRCWCSGRLIGCECRTEKALHAGRLVGSPAVAVVCWVQGEFYAMMDFVTPGLLGDFRQVSRSGSPAAHLHLQQLDHWRCGVRHTAVGPALPCAAPHTPGPHS